MILAGDIGGTKTILALFEKADADWSCYRKQVFPSADFESFDLILDAFLKNEIKSLQSACFGVAGPVINGQCQTTNLPWRLDEAELCNRLDIQAVKLLNDLEATAWGILTLPEDDIAELNPSADSTVKGTIAVIAAGTGLGEAILYRDGEHFHVMATEGGHTDFGSNNHQQDALLKYLRKKYPDHVSYERLVSGEGLHNIYQFLVDSGYDKESAEIQQRIINSDPASVIGEAAVSEEDGICTEAMRIFCEIYGAEAANLALKCLSRGGVYLAGGIAAKILPCLLQGNFMQGFLDKGRYRTLLQKMPVKVCLNPDTALLGGVNYAGKMLQ